MSQIFLCKKSNFTENCVGHGQGSEFQGLFKTTAKIQDLLKIVRTMLRDPALQSRKARRIRDKK